MKKIIIFLSLALFVLAANGFAITKAKRAEILKKRELKAQELRNNGRAPGWLKKVNKDETREQQNYNQRLLWDRSEIYKAWSGPTESRIELKAKTTKSKQKKLKASVTTFKKGFKPKAKKTKTSVGLANKLKSENRRELMAALRQLTKRSDLESYNNLYTLANRSINEDHNELTADVRVKALALEALGNSAKNANLNTKKSTIAMLKQEAKYSPNIYIKEAAIKGLGHITTVGSVKALAGISKHLLNNQANKKASLSTLNKTLVTATARVGRNLESTEAYTQAKAAFISTLSESYSKLDTENQGSLLAKGLIGLGAERGLQECLNTLDYAYNSSDFELKTRRYLVNRVLLSLAKNRYEDNHSFDSEIRTNQMLQVIAFIQLISKDKSKAASLERKRLARAASFMVPATGNLSLIESLITFSKQISEAAIILNSAVIKLKNNELTFDSQLNLLAQIASINSNETHIAQTKLGMALFEKSKNLELHLRADKQVTIALYVTLNDAQAEILKHVARTKEPLKFLSADSRNILQRLRKDKKVLGVWIGEILTNYNLISKKGVK